MIARAWTRRVFPCPTLGAFLHAYQCGHFADDPGEPTPEAWLADDALCQGDDPNPLLAAPGTRRESTLLSGEIRDGRGYHPAATFEDCARTRRMRQAG